MALLLHFFPPSLPQLSHTSRDLLQDVTPTYQVKYQPSSEIRLILCPRTRFDPVLHVAESAPNGPEVNDRPPRPAPEV